MKYMGLRRDDIKLCVGNCHRCCFTCFSKNGRYKKLASNFWPKMTTAWTFYSSHVGNLLSRTFATSVTSAHSLQIGGPPGPQSQCSLQNTTYKRFGTICKGSWFLHTPPPKSLLGMTPATLGYRQTGSASLALKSVRLFSDISLAISPVDMGLTWSTTHHTSSPTCLCEVASLPCSRFSKGFGLTRSVKQDLNSIQPPRAALGR